MDNNYISVLNAINRSQPAAAVNKPVQTSTANTASAVNFKQLLQGLLLSTLSSSSTDASSSDSLLGSSASSTDSASSLLGGSTDSLLSGSSSSNSMSSIMLSLIEQLLATQVNTLQSSTKSTTPSSTIIDEASQSGGGVPYSVMAGLNNSNPVTAVGATNSPEGRPVGGVLTQGFHSTHHALDFGVVIGTPVHATMDGKVIYAGWNTEGYGNLVIVQNGDYKTYFAHLSSIPVALNQMVKAGSVVGLSGSTGNSTGPHVHYEVRKNNVAIDPTSFTLNKQI